jgi:hypothetical protein
MQLPAEMIPCLAITSTKKSLLKPWVAQPMNYPEPTAQQQTQPWLAKVDKEALAD